MSWIEIFGVVSGLVCVVLTVRQNIWCWPVGIVNIVFFGILFFRAKLYADMGLHAVYFILSVYGWYKWAAGTKESDELPVSRISAKEALFFLATTVSGTWLMGYLLATNTDASLPYWDSATTVMSLVAQYLLAKKVLESWVVWVSVDVLYVGVYYVKGLYLTSGLYVLFFFLAASGFLAWRKSMIPESHLPMEPA